MKKIILILTVAVLTFVSCKKETIEPNVEPTVTDVTIEFYVYNGVYNGVVYSEDVEVFDGNSLIGTPTTTAAFESDVFSDNGLKYSLPLGSGENILVKNLAGDTLVRFDGNLVFDIDEDMVLPEWGFISGNSLGGISAGFYVQRVDDGHSIFVINYGI